MRPLVVVCSPAAALVLGATLMGAIGCATPRESPAALSSRRILVLERDFSAFVAQPLRTREQLEQQTAALEQLRLLYLDALSQSDSERDRLLCLLRIAELHLDLGARIRRLPYPRGATLRERSALDAQLSQTALPLEAVGRGVLAQAIDYADTHALDGRFVRRARLYQSLHVGGDGALDRDSLAALKKELTAQTFKAPRTLLEAGRVGQRAARR